MSTYLTFSATKESIIALIEEIEQLYRQTINFFCTDDQSKRAIEYRMLKLQYSKTLVEKDFLKVGGMLKLFEELMNARRNLMAITKEYTDILAEGGDLH